MRFALFLIFSLSLLSPAGWAASYVTIEEIPIADSVRYEENIAAHNQEIDDIEALNRQHEELVSLYENERAGHAREVAKMQWILILTICVALLVIIILIITFRMKLRDKDKTVARNLSEFSRLSREEEYKQTNRVIGETEEETPANIEELKEIGNSIVDYISKTQCYMHPECSRDTIKDGLGVSERTLAKAIVAATGLSFVNYINRRRLEISIVMLEERPEMTINDISAACGFGTVRQFQRIFKQQYGISPSAYREA